MRSASAVFVLVAAGLLAGRRFAFRPARDSVRHRRRRSRVPEHAARTAMVLTATDRGHRSRARPVPPAARPIRNSSAIIRKGIPNTPMPATNMSEEQADKIVAYLRSLPQSRRTCRAAGDAARGKAIFDGQGRLRDVSPRERRWLAPRARPERASGSCAASSNSSSRSSIRRRKCCRRIASTASSTRDGATVTGRLLNHDTFTVQTARLERAAAIVRESGSEGARLRRRRRCRRTRARSTRRRLADVVSYLVSLKGRTTP